MINSAAASDLMSAVEQAASPASLVAAVRALAEARLEVGIPTLIAALGYNNPEAAVAALEGLVQLGDVAVQPLLDRIDDYNYGARAYSFRALAAIAHPQALDVLISAAETDFAPSVRRAAAKGLGQLRWSQLSAEQQTLAQDRALQTLLTLAKDSDWAIRYAAVVGLQNLALSVGDTRTDLVAAIVTRLSQLAQADTDLAVRARVEMAQQQLKATCTQLAAIASD